MSARRLALVLLGSLTLGACASSSAFRAGESAERRQDYDAAVLEYSRAVKQDPDNANYKRGLSRARLRASEAHANAARRFAGRGQYKEALEEYRDRMELKS